MRSPCIGCEFEHMDKNRHECKWCEARCNYAMGIEYSKFTNRPAAGSVIRYGGYKDMTDEAETKACRKCGETKPLDPGFYVAPRCKDGHEGICKDCKNARAKELRKQKKQADTAQSPIRRMATSTNLHTAPEPEKGGIIPVNPVGAEPAETGKEPPKPVETGKEPPKPAETEPKPMERWKERMDAQTKAAHETPRPHLYLDFKDHPDLLDNIRLAAAKEWRTPEGQAMYWIETCIEDWYDFMAARKADREEAGDPDITPWAQEEREV